MFQHKNFYLQSKYCLLSLLLSVLLSACAVQKSSDEQPSGSIFHFVAKQTQIGKILSMFAKAGLNPDIIAMQLFDDSEQLASYTVSIHIRDNYSFNRVLKELATTHLIGETGQEQLRLLEP
jgi:hypothetical protein